MIAACIQYCETFATHWWYISTNYACPGKVFNSSPCAVASCKRLCGLCLRILTILPNSSQTCLIGVIQEIVRVNLDYQRCSDSGILELFVSSVFLLCWMLNHDHWCTGMAIQLRTLYLYLWAVRLPFTTRSFMQLSQQTIILPSPNLSTSVTQRSSRHGFFHRQILT